MYVSLSLCRETSREVENQNQKSGIAIFSQFRLQNRNLEFQNFQKLKKFEKYVFERRARLTFRFFMLARTLTKRGRSAF